METLSTSFRGLQPTDRIRGKAGTHFPPLGIVKQWRSFIIGPMGLFGILLGLTLLGTLESPPHYGAVVGLLAVCGSTHSQSYYAIVLTAIIGPIIALVVVIALGSWVGSV